MNASRAALLAVLAAALLSACAGLREDSASREVDNSALAVENKARESHTLSSLSKIDDALGAYVKDTRRIPESLDLLVPKYLAEVPTVELGVSAHRDKSKVTVYPATVLRDGQIDGVRIKDTGGWGYVFNDRQVVVFVDCTHKSSSGRSWYLERGL